MANETIRLAEYAAMLRYDDLPVDVVQRAKDCIIDTVAVIVLGCRQPWSRIVTTYAQRVGAGGRCRILGTNGPSVHAPARPLDQAALRDKFTTLTRAHLGAEAPALFDRLQKLEDEKDLSWLGA